MTATSLTAPIASPSAFLGVERSVSGQRWVDRLSPAAHQAALAAAQRHELVDLLARVAVGRGAGPDDIADYLEPSLRRLMPDPSTLTDMDAAADRLARALRAGEQVAIFGDYDVDGATSACLLARYFRWNGLDPLIHIPDRIIEGYGPNRDAIDALAKAGASLLVTVDCGAMSHDALAHAESLGLDTVVIDHHQLGDTRPPAVALVNPNRQDDLSGLGHLAAVGVVFLVLVALNRQLRESGWYTGPRREPGLIDWLDLVALGTVADVVPLVGLNRAFVRRGLTVIRRRDCVGLAALADVARLNGPIDAYHLGFLLGPRINAGGRIGDAGLGVRLLMCGAPEEAAGIAARLDRLNSERQDIERRMLDAACVAVEAEGDPADRTVLIACDSNWHPGVVGLVAARLRERFGRPAFAFAIDGDGKATGSGRSIPGVDIGGAVRAAVEAGLALKGGGHAMAAGLTVMRDRLEGLRAFMEERLAEAVAAGGVPEFALDGALAAGAARLDLVSALEAASPFGAGNPEPVFALPAHRLAFAEATEHGHIRCSFAGSDGGRLKAIAFRAGDTPLGAALLAGRGDPLHAAGVLRIDRWGGREEVQLHLRDVAIPAAAGP